MKKFLLPLAAIAFASPAAAQSIVVVTAQSPDSRVLPVAYAELRAGTNDAAIAKLTASDLDARDPSRLINLGTAYARLGRTADARTAYEAAAARPTRSDPELSAGTTMAPRWAERTAPARPDHTGAPNPHARRGSTPGTRKNGGEGTK